MTASRSLTTFLTIVTFAAGPQAAFSSALAVACPDVKAASAALKDKPKKDDSASRRRTEVIPLRFAQSSKAERLLREVYSRTNIRIQPHFVSDDRTNSLIVTANDDQFEVIRKLVKHLDAGDRGTDAEQIEGAVQTRIHVTIHEVTLKRDQLPDLRMQDLTEKAETPTTLNKALNKVGNARILYEIDQLLDSRGKPQKLTLGAQAPYVRSASRSKDGNKMSQIEYERIGLVLTYSGQAKTRNRGTAQVNVEFKRVADSDVEIGNDIMAPIIRNAEHDFEGPFVSDKPVVLLLVDGQTDGNIIVYVTRIEFTIESL